ncbi:MAG: ORC1-type DNA replication protein [Candidatus Aenigmarchaeota archaeon]|nr:ORC1-type DNA replication protein [Candidatus Aenigmarchaeota archaeon]
MNTKDMLLDNETLFKNEEVFTPDYVPDEIAFRDSQIKEMTFAIKPAMRGGRPSHMFLIGPTGTGKTTCIQHLFSEIRETTKSVIPIHLNCQILSTPFKILAEIHKQVLGILPPETGVPLTKVQDDIFGYAVREKKTLLVALDDIIPLFTGDTANKLLYALLRAHESFPGIKVAVFAVSTEDMLHLLDDRVRSIFMPNRIEFPPYKTEEIFQILKERSRLGFYPGVLSDSIIRKISGQTNDMRVAIDTLRKCALNAEMDASREVKEKHLEKALQSVSERKRVDVGLEAESILDIIKKKTPIESGELFEIIRKEKNFSYSKFYRLLQKLKNGKLVNIEQIDKQKGKTSLISIK